jgi:hypothetical protein
MKIPPGDFTLLLGSDLEIVLFYLSHAETQRTQKKSDPKGFENL